MNKPYKSPKQLVSPQLHESRDVAKSKHNNVSVKNIGKWMPKQQVKVETPKVDKNDYNNKNTEYVPNRI